MRHPFLFSVLGLLGRFVWKGWGLFACRYVFGLPALFSVLSFSSETVHTGFTNIQTFSLPPMNSWRETDFKHPGKGRKKTGICLTETRWLFTKAANFFSKCKMQKGNVCIFKCVGVTLVDRLIQVSGVHFCDTR